ncbi:hypothetical protein [Streptomyces hygroscopicus]|uniref:hypothetical protein n=1 Tax=Streptomyces hygroscopicus TaxID=1912 RepID=UPI001FCC1D5D|nr:hypothetical protein [Streptomyces hygroscopicus]BDH10475.1 hypothetical protein HOK021_16540 [Streptomyces hygroscopicus]
MPMNKYGIEARAYWRRWLPERYAKLPAPVAFFTELGEKVEQQVGDHWDTLILQDNPPENETHNERVGRLGRLKAEAEHDVLSEMVRLPPEPIADLNVDEEDGLESDEAFAARITRTEQHTEWLALTTDALVDGAQSLDDLSDEQIKQVLDYMTPLFLGVLGTSVEELRSQGRDV